VEVRVLPGAISSFQSLKATSKAAVVVFKIEVPPVGYQVKGAFQDFQTSGPLFDAFANQVKQMLNIEARYEITQC